MGHWYPCFGLLVTSPLGFKARVGSALFELSGGVHVTLHVPWDSPLVWHLLTSWWPAWQLSHLFHIPASRWCDSKPVAIMPPLTVWDQAGQTLYRLSYPGSARGKLIVLIVIYHAVWTLEIHSHGEAAAASFFAATNGLHWIQCECSHCCSYGNGAASKWVWNPFCAAAAASWRKSR